MRYISTRNKTVRHLPAQAISMGISKEGGLFSPEMLPHLSSKTIRSLCEMSYHQRAVFIMSAFLEDFTASELSAYAEKAYSPKGFDTPKIAPLYHLDANTFFLELWHGPSGAFQDIPLQIFPHLLAASLQKTGGKKSALVLAATMGDTGNAVLESFSEIEGARAHVFYPADEISDFRRLQLAAQAGENIDVTAVSADFDDLQRELREIVKDESLGTLLSQKGYVATTANSTNWGRLMPQIVYYFSAYCDLINFGKLMAGEQMNISIPCGSFGNMLAAYYAKHMGLPIRTLICASNQNDLLTDFIHRGVYNLNRPIEKSLSPAMDTQISPNLERLLFEISGKDDKLIAGYMKSLENTGKYSIEPKIKSRLKHEFWANSCDDRKTELVINATFQKFGYLIDPHTAVAYDVLNHYRHDTGDETPAVVVSTASPFLSSNTVLTALGERAEDDPHTAMEKLARLTSQRPPESHLAQSGKRERHVATTKMRDLRQRIIDGC